jgi:hypothetical protein
MRPAHFPSDYHRASTKLYDEATAALRDELKANDLVLVPALPLTDYDDYEGIADYGTIILRKDNIPFERWFNFGLGWDLETGEEIQFIINWRSDGITEFGEREASPAKARADIFSEFGNLIRKLKEDMR